ncbi:hypothetical protein CH281_03770 [Rhodococcus sp. 06-221-2]|nr:hypothetical protein CH281_03770 [Rhodococcus sp. 06-221-2]
MSFVGSGPAESRGAQMDSIAAFWCHADDGEPALMRSEMNQLLSATRLSRARALFERASLEDFLGEESAAIPLYEAALSSGLDSVTRARPEFSSPVRCVMSGDSRTRRVCWKTSSFPTNSPLREMHSMP